MRPHIPVKKTMLINKFTKKLVKTKGMAIGRVVISTISSWSLDLMTLQINLRKKQKYSKKNITKLLMTDKFESLVSHQKF